MYPVVNVLILDARAFAAWAGKRLPKGREWEKAARGKEGFLYPWGNELDTARANVGSGKLLPVSALPSGASPYGALNMSGNVWELVDRGEPAGWASAGGVHQSVQETGTRRAHSHRAVVHGSRSILRCRGKARARQVSGIFPPSPSAVSRSISGSAVSRTHSRGWLFLRGGQVFLFLAPGKAGGRPGMPGGGAAGKGFAAILPGRDRSQIPVTGG